MRWTTFSNQRGFDKSRAEERAGRLPRFQVDQFEQNVLASRSRLIASCNALERGLDALKLRLGVPPETALNLDLQELEQITLGDQSAVARELVRRAQAALFIEQAEEIPDESRLVSGATNLTQRILELLRLQTNSEADLQSIEIEQLLRRLQVREARLVVQRNRQLLENELRSERQRPLNIFQQRIDLIRALLELGERRLDAGASSPARDELDSLQDSFEELRAGLDTIQDDLARIPVLVQQSGEFLERVAEMVGESEQEDQRIPLRAEVEAALRVAQTALRSHTSGLRDIDIAVDDAMLTALVSRFDLMNERGFTADAWRQVKTRSRRSSQCAESAS